MANQSDEMDMDLSSDEDVLALFEAMLEREVIFEFAAIAWVLAVAEHVMEEQNSSLNAFFTLSRCPAKQRPWELITKDQSRRANYRVFKNRKSIARIGAAMLVQDLDKEEQQATN